MKTDDVKRLIDQRQALDDKPPVKSYCGGVPNYCTPEVTPEVTGEVDAVNISAERVDETAKGEHEPIGYIDGMHGGYMVFTPINPAAVYLNGTALYLAPPKKEWVGYTKEDRERIVPMLVQSLINHDEKTMAGLLNAILIDIEQQLKEKNGG